MSVPELAHLPDLPTAGYATKRERELSDGIMFALRGFERDRLLLLSVVLDGRAKWRRIAGKEWRALRVDHEILDAMFSYLELLACRPRMQQRLLAHANNSGIWRVLMREAIPDLEAQRDALRQIQRVGRG